jgi:hypothetical protein
MALAAVLAIGAGVGVMASQGGDHGHSGSAPGQEQHPPQAQNDDDHGRSGDAPGHNPQSDQEPESGEPPRDIKGIPDENPVHKPADSDGECEKGETVVKTTPAGTNVNVPCQAAKHDGLGHGSGNPHEDDEPD